MKNAIDGILKDIDKAFGPGKLVRASEAKAIVNEKFPTGLLSLDEVLSGGLPIGRIVEFIGPYSGGKTAVSLKIASEFQKAGKNVAFIDAEKSFDTEFSKKIGVNLENLCVAQTWEHEQAIDIIEALIKSREYHLIILDSVTALLPTRVSERSAEEMTIGIEAKLNNLFMRKVVASFSPGDLRDEANKPWCTLVMINQLRANMSGYGVDEPSGGMGIKFFKHLSVEFRRSAYLGIDGREVKDKSKERCGQTISFQVRKNKTGVPWKNGSTDFYFIDSDNSKAGEFDQIKMLFDLSVKHGIIEQSGPFYETVDEKENQKFKGREAFVAFIRENKKFADKLEKGIKTKIG